MRCRPTRSLWLLALTASLSLLPARGNAATPWWRATGPVCPEGAALQGQPPPVGFDIGCVNAAGEWHGRRSVWFDPCDGRKHCKQGAARMRFEGEYYKGLENGHWTFWHPSGRKALEGEYAAGRKVGSWLAWDRKGRLSRTELGGSAELNATIKDALDKVATSGGSDLEVAARALARKSGEGPVDEATRSAGPTQSIAVRADTGVAQADAANPDMGRNNFGEEDNTHVSPYVRGAVQRATTAVNACYRQAVSERSELSGALTVRFFIQPDGVVVDPRVVESTLTEKMSECVRARLAQIKLAPHDSIEPVEVISSWTLKKGSPSSAPPEGG